ncbi:MAG: hypothetical protein WBM17_15870 [Anaerolineales bacterium]
MSIQLFPENIRRFVGELTIGEPDGTAGGRDPVRFEYVDPSFPAEKSYQAFLDFSRDGRKGVDMCSTVFQKTAGSSGISSDVHQNVH